MLQELFQFSDVTQVDKWKTRSSCTGWKRWKIVHIFKRYEYSKRNVQNKSYWWFLFADFFWIATGRQTKLLNSYHENDMNILKTNLKDITTYIICSIIKPWRKTYRSKVKLLQRCYVVEWYQKAWNFAKNVAQ